MDSIAAKISVLIKEKELSYAELSKLTSIPKSALQRYATGETCKIPLDRISAIASALGTTPAYLMGWEEAPEDTSSNKAKLKSIIEDMSEEQAAVLLAAFLSAKTAK